MLRCMTPQNPHLTVRRAKIAGTVIPTLTRRIIRDFWNQRKGFAILLFTDKVEVGFLILFLHSNDSSNRKAYIVVLISNDFSIVCLTK